MADLKQEMLANQLLAKSETGQLTWTASQDEQAIVTRFLNYSVVLSEHEQSTGRSDAAPTSAERSVYRFRIENARGEVVNQFDDRQLGEGWFEDVASLYHSIYGRAEEGDQALDEILAELSEGGPAEARSATPLNDLRSR